jgi:hypothetical protein
MVELNRKQEEEIEQQKQIKEQLLRVKGAKP